MCKGCPNGFPLISESCPPTGFGLVIGVRAGGEGGVSKMANKAGAQRPHADDQTEAQVTAPSASRDECALKEEDRDEAKSAQLPSPTEAHIGHGGLAV